ncbi:MAG TPA: hypothetical protein VM011_03425 [Gammaproteobacteria bacterium]|nr:hypothetical protein [Gammaproteobacteria bacterium]
MKTAVWLVTGIWLACSTVWAQEPNPYSGTWKMSLVNKKGEHRQGAVIIADQEGSWDIERQDVKNPCVGIRAPISINSVSADELVFEIVRSRSLKGCKDNIATLKRVDENTLQGALDDGRTLTLTRE